MDIVIAVQQRLGHVSNAAVQTMAAGLGIHPVEIEDMVSFYAFFDREPRGRNRIRLSKTPVSFMKGAREVAQAFEQALGIQIGETTADGMFTLQWTSDIGFADQEPAALVNGVILTELSPADAPLIIASLRRAGSGGDLPPYPPHAAEAAKLRGRPGPKLASRNCSMGASCSRS